MNSILEHLFRCAMENQKSYLNKDELHDYRTAAREAEKQKEQLEQLLEGESLYLFNLFAKNCDKEVNWSEVSSFRKGFAMGLKIGVFHFSDY